MHRSPYPEPDPFERSPEQLVRAGEVATAAELIASRWTSVSTTQGARVRSIISELPESLWADDPRMLAAMGASYRSVGSPSRSAALPWFRAAEAKARERGAPSVDTADILTHHAAALRSLGRVDAAARTAQSALDILEGDDGVPPRRIRAHASAAVQIGLARVHEGRWADAVEVLRLALGLADTALTRSEVVECLSGLSVAAFFAGDLDAASTYVDRARSTAEGSGLLDSQFGAGALAVETLVAVERNEFAVARELAPRALDAAFDTDWNPLAHYASACLAVIGGGHLEGLDQVRRTLEALSSWAGAPFLATHARVLRGELLMRLGEFRAALATLDTVTPSALHAVCPARFVAGIRYKAGDYEGCLAALAACLDLGDAHSATTVVDVHVLAAAAHLDLGDTVASDLAFDRALLSAAGTSIRTGFLLVSTATLGRLLSRAADRNQPVRVHAVLDAVSADAGTTPHGALEPLSDRELDIAAQLLHDKTVSQIAGALFISTNTVKTHVRSIYRKLAASNRKEAVRRVRELGLAKGTDEPAREDPPRTELPVDEVTRDHPALEVRKITPD
ncbi:LuxR C-terminal-related transcriptional regulator [Marisediminicola sp. LYQ134]|uniref:LuxR C-terminal-related transcriptional regulator n=1 Tax=unclassified Marisediminicola TaxID=2618316 RepID=UPI0039831474